MPDADLFEAVSDGSASIVTDTIDRFTASGIRLESGKELEADLVVTATGLKLEMLAGMDITVDGRAITLSESMAYKGMMFSGVPNLAWSMGYTNASWTLKCDLTCAYVCRLLNHLESKGYSQCTPTVKDPNMATLPWIDFSSGYVQRSLHLFPKQGEEKPWRLYQNYALDILSLRFGSVDDGAMVFAPPREPAVAPNLTAAEAS